MSLPISIKAIKTIPFRHTQKIIPQAILDSAKFTANTNHHM